MCENLNSLFDKYHNDLIPRIIKRNRRLLAALRLETDDVAQELSIRLWRYTGKFDPARSESIEAYLYCILQYEVLNIKRKHKPYGMTGVSNEKRCKFVSLNRRQQDSSTYGYPHGMTPA